MTVQELMEELRQMDRNAEVKVMVGDQTGIGLKEFDLIGSSKEGDEVYIPVNFDAIATHEANREFLN